MSQSNITALQSVLNIITDSREGYLKAAETVEEGRFKRIFKVRAKERSVMVEQLADTIRSRGATPEQDGTALGMAHRNLMSIAAAIQSDEKAAIKTVDDGEERLRETIREAIENGDLTTSDRTMLLRIERELEADARLLERLGDAVD